VAFYGCDNLEGLGDARKHVVNGIVPSTNGHDPAPHWRARAEALATWAEERLVVRRDCYGGYYLDSSGVVRTTTHHETLTHGRVVQHFQAIGASDVIGFHTCATEKMVGLPTGLAHVTLAKYACPELDLHDNDDPALAEANLKAAITWHDRAAGLGFHPLLVDSNGKGGHKLFLLFESLILAATARGLGLWLTRDWQALGLPRPPECFPKQLELKAPGSIRGSFGNWLRPPGRHHRREHWSKVWDGSAWVAGDDAIDEILDRSGDSPTLICDEVLAFAAVERGETGEPRKPMTSAQLKGAAADAKAALEFLKPGTRDDRGREFLADYGAWLSVGMMLHELGDVGLKLWDDWSAQHGSYQVGACAAKFATFVDDSGGVTLASLYWYAKGLGWSGPKRREPALRNFEFVEVKTTDNEGKEKTLVEPRALALPKIVKRLSRISDGWPKRVGEELFVASADHRPVMLGSQAQLFGWLRGSFKVDWRNSSTMATPHELYEHLRKFAVDRFDVIEQFPHWPPVGEAFYLHPEIGIQSGALLGRLLDFFKPATDHDRELIKAAILTVFWGGPPGKRPVFRIEGPEDDDPEKHGRGVGKSTVAELIGSLPGGHLAISDKDTMAAVKTRLLSSENGQKRVVLLDNLKTRRFSWAEYEALVTDTVISGHKMYVGEGQRPNLLTHFVTVNSGSLSKDMCQRSVTIRLKRPEYSASWTADVLAFIEGNRWGLISEIGAILTDELGMISGGSRWALWEHQVLSRCDHFAECRKVILERAGGLDDDDDQVFEFEDMVRNLLASRGHKPDEQRIWIPTSVMGEWFSFFKGEPRAACTATGSLQLMPLKRLKYKRTNASRGWLWSGINAEGDEISLMPFVSSEERDVCDDWMTIRKRRGRH
jgi:hypothetical protein